MVDNVIQDRSKYLNKILYITLFLLIFSIIEIFTRNYSFRISLSLQTYLFTDNKWCHLYEIMAFLELIPGKLLIIVLLTNLLDVFAAFVFVVLCESTNFLNGILKLFFLDPRPFWEEFQLIPCICATNYGTPSTASFLITIMFLSLRRLILKRLKIYSLQFKKYFKTLDFYLSMICGAVIVIISFSRYAQKAHTINQLLYGLVLGYSLYYINFEIIKFDLNNLDKIRYFLRTDVFILINTIILSFFLFSNFFHYWLNFGFKEEWLIRIETFCDIRALDLFDKESYFKSCGIFLIISFYLLIYLEFNLIFKRDMNLFLYYNLFNLNRNNCFSANRSLIRVIITYSFIILTRKIFNVSSEETNQIKYMMMTSLENIFYGVSIFIISHGSFGLYHYFSNQEILSESEKMDDYILHSVHDL